MTSHRLQLRAQHLRLRLRDAQQVAAASPRTLNHESLSSMPHSPSQPASLASWLRLSAAVLALGSSAHAADDTQPPSSLPAPAGPAQAQIDLTTTLGVQAVQGQWRTHPAQVVAAPFNAVGSDRKPSGPPNLTYDLMPRAGALDFDDSSWTVLAPEHLDDRQADGRLCFNWYRINLTVPARVGDFNPINSAIVLNMTVDDYAEVWVNGVLPRRLGMPNPNLVQGWNAPNRVVLTSSAHPGEVIQVAVLGINGPLSDPPANYIWVRNASLEFYRQPRAFTPQPVDTRITRLDSRLDEIISPDARIEKLADGFIFTEGPVWVEDQCCGKLLFSDPNDNRIWSWMPDNSLTLFRDMSGYAGPDIASYFQPGSNGLTLDPAGRLTINEHGNRRITRLEPDGSLTVLADRFAGRRLNSPNDLVYRSDGALFFTDPPFGLPKVYDDPKRELPVCGVYCLKDGLLRQVSTDLKGPNGLAFSPDEKYLYVTNWDDSRKIVMRYDVAPDGALTNARVFFDMTSAPGAEALDGVKVDALGDLFVSGPGGLWVIAPDGTHLGTIAGPELPANLAWGDADRKTLYLTARTGLYRVRLERAGAGPR